MPEFPQPNDRARLEMVYVAIGELVPASYNPRKIKEEEIQKLVRSIEINGFIEPVVVNRDMTIIGGHQRVKAASRAGYTEVPVIFVDLDKDDEKALNIALNRIGGSFDEEMLTKLIQSITADKLQNTGLDANEIENALQKALNPQDDQPPEAPPAEPQARLGDVYLLGDHVLVCGDATKPEDVMRLMDVPTHAHPQGAVADMVFTDPPYNVAYEVEGKEKIANDDLSPAAFREFLLKVNKNLMAHTSGVIYICMSSTEMATLMATFVEAGGHFSSFIIWAKNTFTLGRADWQSQYEPILYGWPKTVKNHYFVGWRDEGNVWDKLDTVRPQYDAEKNKTSIQIGDYHLELDGEVTGSILDKTNQTDVWREKKPARNGVHPTMKPIPLVARAIVASSKLGGTVLDVFGGSFSTLIACEETGRTFRGLELSPAYIQVGIERWIKLTGREAYRLNEDGSQTPWSEICQRSK